MTVMLRKLKEAVYNLVGKLVNLSGFHFHFSSNLSRDFIDQRKFRIIHCTVLFRNPDYYKNRSSSIVLTGILTTAEGGQEVISSIVCSALLLPQPFLRLLVLFPSKPPILRKNPSCDA